MLTPPCLRRESRGSWLTGAEVLLVAVTASLAIAPTLAYLADWVGLPIAPAGTLAATLLTVGLGAAVLAFRADWNVIDVALLLTLVGVVWVYLLRLAWPSFLPLGSGSDLAHHLQLIDYIEQQGHLVHDPDAGARLGEMAHYTPGMHLMAVLAGGLTRGDGLHALYAVVALSVALKAGVLWVILLRACAGCSARRPLALVGVMLMFVPAAYTLQSFTRDSFLAQVVAELFAVSLLWATIVWDAHPTRAAMALFALFGVATFLTWPVWIGPPVLGLVLVAVRHHTLPWRLRGTHLALALAPVVAVAALYAAGRSGWLAMAGASGAVVQPSLPALGWTLPLLAAAGLLVAVITRQHRAVVVFVVALGLQALALLALARMRGSGNAYMAVKMMYLAIYPAVVLAIAGASTAWDAISRMGAHADRRRWATAAAWALAAAIGAALVTTLEARPRPQAIATEDLWAVGTWAREHLPADCVDYVVGNEHTAYWLHLAVLRNPRASPRTADDGTFFVQPSMARWLEPNLQPSYAIADFRILPQEIRGEVDVLRQFGSVAAIKRRGPSRCP